MVSTIWMTHFAAMLDGSYIKKRGWQEENIHQRGASNYVFPSEDLQDLQKAIDSNRTATTVFSTIGLPLYFLMDVLATVLDTVKKVINSTILYLLTPVAAILGGIVKGVKGSDKYQELRERKDEYRLGGHAGEVDLDEVSTLVFKNSHKAQMKSPIAHIKGVDKKGFRSSKLLTMSYHERILGTGKIFDRIFNLPHKILQLFMLGVDHNEVLRTISWVLFPVRWALKMLEIGLEAAGKTLSAVFKLASYPIVGIVHGFSLIKYKQFKAAVKDLDIEVTPQENDQHAYVEEAAEVDKALPEQQKIEDLVNEGSSYKQMFNNPHFITDVRLERAESGQVYIHGTQEQYVGHELQQNTVRLEITEENRDTVLAALHRNAFGWARSLEMKSVHGEVHYGKEGQTQLDEAVEICSGAIAPPRLGGSDEVIEL